MKDPIVEEVRRVRAQIAEECGFDLDRIAEHARDTAAKVPGLKYVTPQELRARRGAADRTKTPSK
jgi:hypothetical protein